MFSLDNFYNIIHSNLLDNNSSLSYYFKKFNFNYDPNDGVAIQSSENVNAFVFYDQEPLSSSFLRQFQEFVNSPDSPKIIHWGIKNTIFVNNLPTYSGAVGPTLATELVTKTYVDTKADSSNVYTKSQIQTLLNDLITSNPSLINSMPQS